MESSYPYKTVVLIGVGYIGLHLASRILESETDYDLYCYDINPTASRAKAISMLSTTEDINYNTYEKISQAMYSLEDTIEQTKNKNKIIISTVPIATMAVGEDLVFYGDLYKAYHTMSKLIMPGDLIISESSGPVGTTRKLIDTIENSYDNGFTDRRLSYPGDFNVAYCPERTNPGDKVNTIETIVQPISSDFNSVSLLAERFYKSIGVKNTIISESIEATEMSKLVENSQRYINIQFMNEVSMICESNGVSFSEVNKINKTKWNFSEFSPGLVGGPCLLDNVKYLSTGVETHILKESQEVDSKYTLNTSNKFAAKLSNTLASIINSHKENNEINIYLVGMGFKHGSTEPIKSKILEVIDDALAEIKIRQLNKRVRFFIADFYFMVKEQYKNTNLLRLEGYNKDVISSQGLRMGMRPYEYRTDILESDLDRADLFILGNTTDDIDRRVYDLSVKHNFKILKVHN